MGFMGKDEQNKYNNYRMLYIFHDHLWATTYNDMFWSINDQYKNTKH